MILRKLLRENGYPGYRLHWKIAGKPDIVFPGKKIAIFINGCFWHRCPYCHPSMPKHNAEFWADKFEKNIERDKKDLLILETSGWKTIVVWECEINKDPSEVVRRITSVLIRNCNQK